LTVQAGQKLNFAIAREGGLIFWSFPVIEVILNPQDELLTVPYHVQLQYGDSVISISGLEIDADGTYTLLVTPNYSGQISITVSVAK
jgi:hypothetical protein